MAFNLGKTPYPVMIFSGKQMNTNYFSLFSDLVVVSTKIHLPVYGISKSM